MSYRVFIDMDGTLARFHAENNYLERMYEPSFFSGLAPYENAVDTATKLAEGGEAEVFVISAVIEGYPPGDCAEQKHAWLDEHLPMIDRAHRIFPPMGANKTEYVPEGVRADDLLVDDYNKNLEEWRTAGGTSVKFVNDINDRGLVGKRWEGERVYYSASAEDTAARLGEIANIAQEEQASLKAKLTDASFASQVDAVLSGADAESTHLKLMDTPPLLRLAGVPDLPLLMTAKHLEKITSQSEKGKNNHGLDIETVKKLPELISDPVIIADSFTRDDSIVVVCDAIDSQNRPIIAAIKLDGTGRLENRYINANIMTSAYGRNNFQAFLNRMAESGAIIYWSKKRSQALSVNPGVQFPDIITSLNSDIIIHKAKAFVNGNLQKNEENLSEQAKSPVIDLEELLDEAKDRIEEKAAIEGEAVAPQAPAPTVPSVKREELPKEKDKLEARLAARIENLVSDFAIDPDKLMEHIRFTARFHKYSSRNLMLIAEQYPTASFIASFSKFAKGIPDKDGVPLTDKDCGVKKGERAIYIYGYRSTEYVVDPDTGRELAVRHLSDKLAARARAEGWEKRTRTYYPIVPVFDISQTNTPPEVYPAVMGFGGTENRDVDAQFRAAKNYAENVLGCSVEICDMGAHKISVRGDFTPSENAIRISSMLSGDGALSTLLHKIGHAELHTDEEYLKDKPLSQIELEADMLAVMYEERLGIVQTDAHKAHLHAHYTRYLEQLRSEQGEGYDLLGKDSPFEHVVAKYQERIELFDEFQRLQEDFDLEAKAAQSRAVAVAPEMKPAESENRSAKTSGTKI